MREQFLTTRMSEQRVREQLGLHMTDTSEVKGESHYAVIRARGKQLTVKPGTRISIDRIHVAVGEEVSFEDVLLISDTSSPDAPRLIGSPIIQGASVRAVVLRHFRDKKILTFKKKKRTGYKRRVGHRQDLTELLVQRIAV